MVAAEIGSVSGIDGFAGATVAGSMLGGTLPSLKEAQLTLDIVSLFGDVQKVRNAVAQLCMSSSH